MNIEGIVIIENQSGLPLFSKLESSINDTLFSGFLTAIKSFANELSLGGISSFKTDEKNIHLIARNQIITSIITSKDEDENEILSLGYKIGEKFETTYELDGQHMIDLDKYSNFGKEIDSLLSEVEIPFLIKAAEFSKKEFGGNISVEPILVNNNNEQIKIDLISDRGEKKAKGLLNHLARKILKSFSEEITFIKVIDGTAGRGEVTEFLDLMKTFGKLRHKSDEEQFPFYPSKAVIISRDYSPTVFDDLNKLPTYKDKHNIPGTHISPDAGMRGAPSSMKCFVELWKWSDEKYPERIFN